MSLRIRPAAVEDAEAVARVHVQSWQVAYRAILPSTYLDSLDVAERSRTWQRILGDHSRGGLTLVAESERGWSGSLQRPAPVTSTRTRPRWVRSRPSTCCPTELRYRRALP
ncbi:MAG TPA: hypothetical protein VFR87_11695 [Nocardioidaceae bacterium]|nr:hypothetical protein [Nocardioidaceae bacterium]